MRLQKLLLPPILLCGLYAQDHDHSSHESLIPEVSLTLDTSLVNRSLEDVELAHLEIPGIAHGLMSAHAHNEHAHPVYNADNGFNLNYGELALYGIANPYFELKGIFHLSEHGLDIEEAYFATTSLPYNLKFRGGKFRSDFGLLNHQHRHNWDFSDMALIYLAFVGSHGINEIGAQLQWVIPTSTYLMVGAEILQGENEQIFGRSAITLGEELVASSASAPSLFIGYLKASLDINDATELKLGASIALGDARLDNLEAEEPHAFYGESSLYGIEMTLKHTLSTHSYLNWQSEWLYRELNGKEYNAQTNLHVNLNKKQAGYYTQLIYAYDEQWRTGVRYDNIYKNNITANSKPQGLENNFDKYSIMIDYAFSESTRLRLQYNRNNAMFNEEGERQHIDTCILQFNISIGTHKGHDEHHL